MKNIKNGSTFFRKKQQQKFCLNISLGIIKFYSKKAKSQHSDQYTNSTKKLDVLRNYIDENFRKKFIRKSKSPTRYPILFAPKKNGGLKFCVDYKKLNNIIVKNRYFLPNIGELQDRFGNAKNFTKLNLRSAYNLIRMKNGEKWKTVFKTRYGHYEYLVMPFGFTNAPATCQVLINNVLKTYLDRTVVIYFDDILIYFDEQEHHVQHMQKKLICLSQAALFLKPGKCEFHKKKVEFLGFIVNTEGIHMNPKKLKPYWNGLCQKTSKTYKKN